MNHRIQIIDHLRADRGLSEDEPNRRKRIRRVGAEHINKRKMLLPPLRIGFVNKLQEEFRELRNGTFAPLEKLSNLTCRLRRLLSGHTLGGVCQKELVAFFDGIDSSLELVRGAHPAAALAAGLAGALGPGLFGLDCALTSQRAGSWWPRYWSRSTVPVIIAFVNQILSGLTAK